MEPTRVCSKCKQPRPFSKFQHYNGKPSGQCRECKTEAMKSKRRAQGIPEKKLSKIEGGKKLCMDCNELKPFSDFHKSDSGMAGLASYCKPCQKARYYDREKARLGAVRYRVRNRERYLANHRLTQYLRKTGMIPVTDGTVTKDFLVRLYDTTHCFYCGEFTEKSERTADHKVALASGGKHSATNLVMACFTCNSRKRDLSVDEFLKRLDDDRRSRHST